MKKCALIGYTGFVGSNLLRQASFQALYNSSNIKDIEGQTFATVICAGAPGAKWKANQYPEEDTQAVNSLMQALQKAEAERFILISTVDVYSNPVEVDEDARVDSSALHAYGQNRFRLEEFVRQNFIRAHVIRLPGLFGKGLKKNIIYDFLHNNQLDMIHCDSVFQFYYLDHAYSDIMKTVAHNIPLINFSTEPISVHEVAKHVFGIEFSNIAKKPPARYNVKSKYVNLFRSDAQYMYTKRELLDQMKRFVGQFR